MPDANWLKSSVALFCEIDFPSINFTSSPKILYTLIPATFTFVLISMNTIPLLGIGYTLKFSSNTSATLVLHKLLLTFTLRCTVAALLPYGSVKLYVT